MERCKQAGEGEKEFGEKKWHIEKNPEIQLLSLSPLFLTPLVCLLLPFFTPFVISTDELPCNIINLEADVGMSFLSLLRYGSKMQMSGK